MIESLLISIAAVGVLLVLFLLSQVRKVNEDLRLKKHQSTDLPSGANAKPPKLALPIFSITLLSSMTA